MQNFRRPMALTVASRIIRIMHASAVARTTSRTVLANGFDFKVIVNGSGQHPVLYLSGGKISITSSCLASLFELFHI